jgi:hypothetical protein
MLPVNYVFRERVHMVLIIDKNGMSISQICDYNIIIKMWRYYVDWYCGIVCTKIGGKMNLRATL